MKSIIAICKRYFATYKTNCEKLHIKNKAENDYAVSRYWVSQLVILSLLHRLQVWRNVQLTSGVVLDVLHGEAFADFRHGHAVAFVNLEDALGESNKKLILTFEVVITFKGQLHRIGNNIVKRVFRIFHLTVTSLLKLNKTDTDSWVCDYIEIWTKKG